MRQGPRSRKPPKAPRVPAPRVTETALARPSVNAQLDEALHDAPVEPRYHVVAERSLREWNKGRPDGTVRGRLGDLARLGEHFWEDADPVNTLARLFFVGPVGAREVVRDWLTHQKRTACKDTTILRRACSVKGAIEYASAEYGVPGWSLVFRPGELPAPVPYGRSKGPPWRQVEQVVGELRAAGELEILALLLLSYDVGLRRFEAVGLRWEWVDLVAATITTPRKRKPDGVTLALTPRLVVVLDELRDREGTSRTWVFPGKKGKHRTSEWAYHRVRALGLGKIHGMRHSGAGRAVELSDGKVQVVQGYLGHENLQTSQVYMDESLQTLQHEAVSLWGHDFPDPTAPPDGVTSPKPQPRKRKRKP